MDIRKVLVRITMVAAMMTLVAARAPAEADWEIIEEDCPGGAEMFIITDAGLISIGFDCDENCFPRLVNCGTQGCYGTWKDATNAYYYEGYVVHLDGGDVDVLWAQCQ